MGQSNRKGTVPIQRGGWLDLLRFIAAFLMILYHYQFAAPIPVDAFPAVFHRGYLVTNFFLIDSGYVLGRIYADRVASGRMSYWDFFKKRALRVMPLHWITLLALVGMVILAGAAGVFPVHPVWFDWKELPGELFLVQAYGLPGGHGWNTPTWSLSALLGCYLLFPFVARAIGRLSGLAALAAAVALFAVFNVATHKLLGYPVYAMPLSIGFIRALPLFIIGIALARFSETVVIPERVAMLGGIAAAAALAAIQAFGDHDLVSLALIATVILAAAAIPVRKPSKLVAFGAVASFSMYISNEIVRIGWFGAVRVLGEKVQLSTVEQWALWALGIGAALVCASALYAWVDAPTQRWVAALRAPSKAKAGAEQPA